MSNLPTLFNYCAQEVRAVLIDGNIWWVATDVCKILEIKNVSDAVEKLDDDEKNTIAINDGTPGNPNKLCVNEPGLYSLIFTSRKSEAKDFKRWVTHEVIPSIRKTGSYSVSQG